MMPKNKALLSAFQSVLVSWGDVDMTVPAFAAQRIRFNLQNQESQANGHLTLERGQPSVEPQPVPWRLSLATAETIDAVTQMARLIDLMPEQVASPTRAALSRSLTEINGDEPCPTGKVWRYRFPRPKFSDKEFFYKSDFIVAATLLHAAAEVSSDKQLASDFGGLADHFLEQGL